MKKFFIVLLLMPLMSRGACNDCWKVITSCWSLKPNATTAHQSHIIETGRAKRGNSTATTNPNTPASVNQNPYVSFTDEPDRRNSDSPSSRKTPSSIVKNVVVQSHYIQAAPILIPGMPPVPQPPIRIRPGENVSALLGAGSSPERISGLNLPLPHDGNDSIPTEPVIQNQAPSALPHSAAESERSEERISPLNDERVSGRAGNDDLSFDSDEDPGEKEEVVPVAGADQEAKPRKKCRPQHFTFSVDHILRSAMRSRDNERRRSKKLYGEDVFDLSESFEDM